MSACVATGASTTRRPDTDPLLASLDPWLSPGQPVAVACSGGLDSLSLLDATREVAVRRGVPLVALHVHHGLSAHADQWAAFVASVCASWDIECHAAKVRVSGATGEGIEAEARRLRYAALTRLAHAAGCARVLLAHHAQDQAETLLLQALRGAGVTGLAAMPTCAVRHHIEWVRPWLTVRREAIADWAQARGLGFVEDDSNRDQRYARNRLRHGPLAALETAFPGAVEALGHVASQAQEALECLEALAHQDLAVLRVAATGDKPEGLDVQQWCALSPARRSLALRTWLMSQTGRPAERSLVLRVLAELQPDGQARRWPLQRGRQLTCYRGVLRCGPAAGLAQVTVAEHPAGVEGATLCAIPGRGVVAVQPACPGVPRHLLQALSWRPREGGEQFQWRPGGVPRSLKKCFQAAGVPAWERDVPLLYAGDRLLLVPSLGVDARWWCDDGEDLVMLRWVPLQSAESGLV